MDKQGRYSLDLHGSSFSEDLEDAYVFVAEPKSTIAVRAVPVTLARIRDDA